MLNPDARLPYFLLPILVEFAKRKGVSLDDVVRDWAGSRARADADPTAPLKGPGPPTG